MSGKMFNAFIAFSSTLLLGVIIFLKLFWDGSGIMSFKFTKWFFGIVLIAALIAGVGFYS